MKLPKKMNVPTPEENLAYDTYIAEEDAKATMEEMEQNENGSRLGSFAKGVNEGINMVAEVGGRLANGIADAIEKVTDSYER